MKTEDVCILIPGYNEAKNISRVVTNVQSLGFPVLVVDDGSKDDMAACARAAGAEVLSYSPNQGKGAAIRHGIDWFLKNSTCQAVILMDSDGQHDPADLSDFLKALEEPTVGLVAGNRMNDPKGMPFVRRLTNRTMSGILSLICGQFVPDTQCGYRAVKRQTLLRMKLQTSHFEIESEMILEAARSKTKILSIPVKSVYEGGGSNIRPGRDTVRFFKFLFKYLVRPR